MTLVAPPPGREVFARAAETMTRVIDQARTLTDVASRQASLLAPSLLTPPPVATRSLPVPTNPLTLLRDAAAYAVDAGQRGFLFRDAMRQAGNAFVEHEEAGCPPVLFFDWDMVVDGRTLPRPCNYALVRIQPSGGRRADRPQAAALRHHRPARRPRRRHRRLQVGQPGGRGAAPRPSGLFRDLLPRPGARPDHPRHHPGRGDLPASASTKRIRKRRSRWSSAIARAAGR